MASPSDSEPAEHPAPFNLALGISLGLLASFIQSLGLTIQRKSHLQNDRLPPASRKPDYARPVWLVGFTIYFSFNILGSIFQIGTLPLIILGPLGAISLLWNAILARLLLADRFSPHLIFGTILIGLGALLIGLYGLLPDQSASHDLDQLIFLYSRTPFLVEIILLLLTFSLLCSFAHLYEFRLNQSLETISLLTISPTPTPPDPNNNNRLSRHSLNLPPNHSHQHQNKHINHHHYPAYRPRSLSSPTQQHHPLSLSFPHQPIDIIDSHIPLTPPFSNKPPTRLSRTLTRSRSTYSSGPVQLAIDKDEPGGGQGLLSRQKIDQLKLLIGIAYGSTSGTLSGICLLFAKTGVELLIRSLTGTALRLVNPTLICPLAFCFYNLSSIVSSLVYYDQVKLLSAFQVFAISLGTIILLGGVWVGGLGGRRRRSNAALTVLPTVYSEDPGGIDDSFDSSPPRSRRTTLLLQRSESSSSPHNPRRTSHPFDQLIRQFLVEGEVTPVRGFSIGLGAASPGFAIRPKKRRKERDGLLPRSSLSGRSDAGHLDPSRPSPSTGLPSNLFLN
ncbi:hypothetical protein PtA15_3A804 [Puccinia triticina]|uniref:Magnesium transporter NIPA n=1 Tax=Puccinia triticina TaxID=208348 RepID=A0ABY7CED7_9BASI|nr:uncharacterized protein PtA15_3A804 [Puccinia triticina]WAQ83434.1 hypothetical protein PtA15_3A804 [Puccinia triticina]WAR54275.1 hypothetical protein PtB15_3B789 [Puccinia triticina]